LCRPLLWVLRVEVVLVLVKLKVEAVVVVFVVVVLLLLGVVVVVAVVVDATRGRLSSDSLILRWTRIGLHRTAAPSRR